MAREGSVAALGEAALVQGFALAGARVVCAEDADAARRAWRSLPQDVAVVILTPNAARSVGPDVECSRFPSTVVMPP
ncbi:MAG TPA: V-type ATP synthase subunit F [Actinocrinis sp.]|nr:V-type ATP synthase subunit F [Actinocrinis sp.]